MESGRPIANTKIKALTHADSALKTYGLLFHNGRITMLIIAHTNIPYRMPVTILFCLASFSQRYKRKSKMAQLIAMAKWTSNPVMVVIAGLENAVFPKATLEMYCRTSSGEVPRFYQAYKKAQRISSVPAIKPALIMTEPAVCLMFVLFIAVDLVSCGMLLPEALHIVN